MDDNLRAMFDEMDATSDGLRAQTNRVEQILFALYEEVEDPLGEGEELVGILTDAAHDLHALAGIVAMLSAQLTDIGKEILR